MAFDAELLRAAEEIVRLYAGLGLKLTAAESCTGGLLCGLLTEIPGSSAVVERGFVVYSNAAKVELCGVPAMLVERHGAVSAETARALAQGALAHARAHVAVAITGVAGPGGGTAEKPVGLVHFACARANGPLTHVEKRYGDLSRAHVRRASLAQALAMLRDAAEPHAFA
ncbi:MAG: CinA family protein [Hyphomicrobiales bacterium]|nr:CinA family protein [Hyphomicrobiales bacterium]